MQIKTQIADWFESRNKEVRQYQIDQIYNTEQLLNGKPVVLNACPGAGKSAMAMVLKERYLKKIKGSRAIFLAHGTDLLRTQYANRLTEYKPDFTWQLVKRDEVITNQQVIVTLPQAIYNKDLSEFDNGKTLLVIDEAHHYFNGDMIQTIINKVKPKHILLLTGTPSPFVLRKFPMTVVPMTRLIKDGYLSNVSVELATVASYSYGIGDLNGTDGNKDVKLNYKWTKSDTNKTLDKLLKKIRKRLELDGSWKKVAHSMCKTMYVCRHIEQAKHVQQYFKSQGVNSALSVYETDVDSLEIERFIDSKNNNCPILIVVYRGILGFDYNKLCNLIDLSGTANIDRLFQMMSRLVRPYKHNKIFLKVIPVELKAFYRPIMNAALSLIDEDGIRMWNGKNFHDIEILTKEMSESDYVVGQTYDGVRIVKKHPIDGGFLYDVEILDLDDSIVEQVKKLTYVELLEEVGVLPRGTRAAGPGFDNTTREQWLEGKLNQVPLDLTDFEFFVEAKAEQKKHGIYALTTIKTVYQTIGILRRATSMTFEICVQRFKKLRDECMEQELRK